MTSASSRVINVLVVGSKGTGQNTLTSKFLNHDGSSADISNTDTPSSHLTTRTISIDNIPYTVDIQSVELDYASHLDQLIATAHAYLLCYSTSSPRSLIDLRSMHAQIVQHPNFHSPSLSMPPLTATVTNSSTIVMTHPHAPQQIRPLFIVGTHQAATSTNSPNTAVPKHEAQQLATELHCQRLFGVDISNNSIPDVTAIEAKPRDAEQTTIDELFTELVSETVRLIGLHEAQLESFGRVVLGPPPPAGSIPPPNVHTTTYTPKTTNSRLDTNTPYTPNPTFSPTSPLSTNSTNASNATPYSPSLTSPSRKSSTVLDRLKLGSLRRKVSVQSLTRKKSGSFGEGMFSFGRPTKDSLLSPSADKKKGAFQLDVDTGSWRDSVKWPKNIISE